MGRNKHCFLCNKERSKQVAFHRIPKNPATRPAWLSFCNLDETVDDVSTVEICSGHFTSADYIDPKAKELGYRLVLKPGSIPSIRKPQPRPHNLSALTSITVAPLRPSEAASEHIIETTTNIAYSHLSEPVPSTSLQCLEEETSGVTPKKKMRFSEPRYVGEIRTPHLSTPRRAKRCLNLAKKKIFDQSKKIIKLRQTNRQLRKKICNLEQLVNHLKRNKLITENGADSLVEGLPESMKELISRKLKTKKSNQYTPELRKFALTLQFYSTSAYNYVRRVWKNLLPHPSTLRQWYSVVNGKPGFSKEAFSAITTRNTLSPVYLNIVLDEMSIRSQVVYDNGYFYGGVDIGTDLPKESDNFREATNALVFMAVALNGHWKVPLGYFLIDGLSGSERANLLVKCLELIKDTGAKVFSITFDGAPVNLSMCTSLGANFDYFGKNFKPSFINPSTNEKIWVFWDACHMLKLIRNTLGDKKILIDLNGNFIKWDFLVKLYDLQCNEGLHAGTKLTRKHIFYQDNRMNVKLAAQVLSERVYNAFKFTQELQITEFENCMPTAEFCLKFNNIFDLLNCKNKFSKKNKFNIPIEEKSMQFLLPHAKELENYIAGLRDDRGIPILKGNRKTGFLGLIICLRNIFELYSKLKELGQTYLLSYKLSQDFLETFFSVIRSRGGFNNNPNARQFETAYKRLLVRHEISNTYNSNCLADEAEILYASSSRKNVTDSVIDEDDIHWDMFDHDYISTLWTLTPYVENVVNYISGFVVKKILKSKSVCDICAKQLVTKNESVLLINIKNRGNLIFPSEDVCKICIVAERIFREHIHMIFVKKYIKQYLLLRILKSLKQPFDSQEMHDHILTHDILDNHRIQLTKLIIESFLNIRLFHEAKTRTQKDENIRQKYTKLVLFKHQ